MIKRLVRAGLDKGGLIASVYDARARVGYMLDRETREANERFLASGSPDGLPMPSPALVYRVAGHFNLQWFYESGVEHAELIRSTLAANGIDVEAAASLLDFGCGCGRVVRHWSRLDGTAIHGSDYNGDLIEWCRGALPFATFTINALEPPLPYEQETFDLVYAISVFTHLTEDLQHRWMRELERILAPGGTLLVTTKGRSRLAALTPEELARFERGELVVQEAGYAGKNLCAAFHPETYVRERLAGELDVVAFVPVEPGGSQTQDVFVLRRPR